MNEKPRTLLVVDDQPLNVKMLKTRFSHMGYSVLEALNGEEALEKARLLPDLILLDVMMPGMNGFETCRRLKDDPLTADIPIIFLSAVNDAIIKVNGLQLGGVDYISKPFDSAELLTRVKTHLKIRDQERELAEYARRLEQMVEERTTQLVHADRLATLGTFSAAIVHEINTPLTYVGGNAELMRAGFEAARPILERHLPEDGSGRVARFLEKADKCHDAISQGLERITRMVSTLRNYSTRGSGQREPCRLLDAVEDSARLLGHRIRSARVTLKVSVSDDLRVLCDRQRMSQVLVNLLGNAMDAMGGKEGEIGIAAAKESEYVRIVVKDSGPGIPLGLAEAVFEPFFTTKPREMGTGLGLFIVRSIIEECGGSVTLAPFDGSGAELHIQLPS